MTTNLQRYIEVCLRIYYSGAVDHCLNNISLAIMNSQQQATILRVDNGDVFGPFGKLLACMGIRMKTSSLYRSQSSKMAKRIKRTHLNKEKAMLMKEKLGSAL